MTGWRFSPGGRVGGTDRRFTIASGCANLKSLPRPLPVSAMRDTESLPDPLSDRSCGECTVCCVALTIEDPELRKAQGYRCKHLAREGGCGIYETRPDTCRTFYCGWRRLKWVRAPLRPDLSDVLIQLHWETSQKDGSKRLGVAVTLLHRRGLKAEGLAETLAAAVAAGAPVFLNIPGPPGFTMAQAKINAALEAAVAARDKAGVLRIMTDLYVRGRGGPRKRVVLGSGPAG